MDVRSEDIMLAAESEMIDWNRFAGRTVMITGATGLIGRLLTDVFLYRNRVCGDGIRLLLPVRNKAKAERLYQGSIGPELEIILTELSQLHTCERAANYVIHCAAPTQSAFFVEHPAEAMAAIWDGTRAVLEYARKQRCSGIVCLSSMEVFGQNSKEILAEEDLGALSLSSVRSSYPQTKRTAELLCFAYCAEYGLPVKTARLAQTFGPGVLEDDGRVFMQFCGTILDGTDIVLQTTGETVSNYCYTTDAVLGILKVLLDGENGGVYSLVNDDAPTTIRDIAQWLIDTHGNGTQTLRFDLSKQGKYAVTNRSRISNAKARSIGWEPRYSVKMGYERLLQYLKENGSDQN